VVDIWAEVLKLERVGIHDDFFEVGGHSLAAAKVMARIKQRLDVDLPLSQLFLTPSAAALADVLAQRNPKRRLLVPLRESGDAAPLFLFHPAGGEVFCYARVVEALDDAFPVFGVQSPKRAGVAAENGELEAQCERYFDEILASHGGAPCYLGGYSLGGTIALQVAWLLEQRGVEVLGVAMLDTTVGRMPETPKRSEALVDFLDTLAQSSRTEIVQMFGADSLALHGRLSEAASRIGMAALAGMIERADPALEAQWDFALDDQGSLLRMHERMILAERVQRFVPKPINAPIFSFWAEETLAEGHEPTSWWPYSNNDAQRTPVQILPGDHPNFIRESRNARAIGRALSDFLHSSRLIETGSQDEAA
jgi:thioesterase domain-containing protein/acyl carrier protein